MSDDTNNKDSKKKGQITEDDISKVLQRHSATTVLALLEEVSKFEGADIDWNEIVKTTSTGISCPTEYRMLWRSLAYGHDLSDKLDHAVQLRDSDSDLEYELEAYPEVNSEAEAEATTVVQMLMGSGSSSDANQANTGTVEAPLTINIPKGQSTSENSQPAPVQRVNIRIPVSVQKQPTPTVTVSEGMDVSGSQTSNNLSRRKRKPWTEIEDLELIAAVEKFGEGNWATIVKGDFKGDRTPSQLSQRWAIIRKKHCVGLGGSSSNSQLSEAQRAARHAMNMALDPPTRNTFVNSAGGQTCSSGSVAQESLIAKQETQKRPAVTRYSIMGTMGSAAQKGQQPKDPVRAAALAAGARIASQSDAAPLLKAAQAIHIMPSNSIRPSMLAAVATTHSEIRPAVSTSPNVATLSTTQTPLKTSSESCPPQKQDDNKEAKAQEGAGGCDVKDDNESEVSGDKEAKLEEGNNKSEVSGDKEAIAQEGGAGGCDVKDNNKSEVSGDKEAKAQEGGAGGCDVKDDNESEVSGEKEAKLEEGDKGRVDALKNKAEESDGKNESCSTSEAQHITQEDSKTE